MTIEEINENLELINQIHYLSTIDKYTATSTNNISYHKIDDIIIHQIDLLNNSYDEQVINTPINLNGVTIGDLYYLKNRELVVAELSTQQFYAFLSECSIEDLSLTNYIFKYNYVMINNDYIDDFHSKYLSTAVIWGGFKILEDKSVVHYYKKQLPIINIPYELNELDNYAKDSIYRALEQKSAFERFLKLYHLLELEFDYSLIKKIQNLNISTDSNKIANLLHEYKKSEYDRLLDLISNKCSDTKSIAHKLNLIKPYIDLGEEIFIKFGKGDKSMNLIDPIKYKDLVSDNDAFINATAVKTNTNIDPSNYNKFIHSITAYWIYRIRCSIAHFKIGEYVLTGDKEDFIVEFAEPLIKEVLLQFYKK